MAIKNSQHDSVTEYESENYRVIYTIEDKILKVFVIDIGDRKNIYD